MTRSGSFAVDSLPPNTAIGYTKGDQDAPADAPLHSNASELPGRGSSAGGGYSTAQDLMKFLKALRERRIANGPPAGLGVAGGSGGINAVVEGELPGGYDLIVLSNLDPPAAERVSQMVRGWLGASDDRAGAGCPARATTAARKVGSGLLQPEQVADFPEEPVAGALKILEPELARLIQRRAVAEVDQGAGNWSIAE